MEMMTIYVIGFFVLIAIAGIFIAINLAYEHFVEKRIKSYCQSKGHKYLLHMDNTLKPYLLKTHLASGGTWARFAVMHKTPRGGVTTAVWYNKEGGGKYSTTYAFQIAMIPVSFKSSGHMYMRKEGVGDKLKNVFGVNDLDFEHTEFSNKYFVNAKPEKFGYDFFHPRMIELFLDNRKYFAMIRRDHLIVYRNVPVKKGFIAMFGLIGGSSPQIKWMEEARDFALEVEKKIPKMMKVGGK